MNIGIDISQIAHEGTGIGRYVRELVRSLVVSDSKNTYILLGCSLRKRHVFERYYRDLAVDRSRVILKTFAIPPTLLDILWNVLHIIPVEWLIGTVDVFWSSDWTQPPLRHARGITTVHDLTIFRFPRSFARSIVAVQKRRLKRVMKECDMILSDSVATKNDIVDLLHIDGSKIRVVYPGFTLKESA